MDIWQDELWLFCWFWKEGVVFVYLVFVYLCICGGWILKALALPGSCHHPVPQILSWLDFVQNLLPLIVLVPLFHQPLSSCWSPHCLPVSRIGETFSPFRGLGDSHRKLRSAIQEFRQLTPSQSKYLFRRRKSAVLEAKGKQKCWVWTYKGRLQAKYLLVCGWKRRPTDRGIAAWDGCPQHYSWPHYTLQYHQLELELYWNTLPGTNTCKTPKKLIVSFSLSSAQCFMSECIKNCLDSPRCSESCWKGVDIVQIPLPHRPELRWSQVNPKYDTTILFCGRKCCTQYSWHDSKRMLAKRGKAQKCTQVFSLRRCSVGALLVTVLSRMMIYCCSFGSSLMRWYGLQGRFFVTSRGSQHFRISDSAVLKKSLKVWSDNCIDSIDSIDIVQVQR